jgi:hypothetical protein
MEYPPPLEKLIGKEWMEKNPVIEMERQMSKIAPQVVRDMDLSGISHHVKLDLHGEERQLSWDRRPCSHLGQLEPVRARCVVHEIASPELFVVSYRISGWPSPLGIGTSAAMV